MQRMGISASDYVIESLLLDMQMRTMPSECPRTWESGRGVYVAMGNRIGVLAVSWKCVAGEDIF